MQSLCHVFTDTVHSFLFWLTKLLSYTEKHWLWKYLYFLSDWCLTDWCNRLCWAYTEYRPSREGGLMCKIIKANKQTNSTVQCNAVSICIKMWHLKTSSDFLWAFYPSKQDLFEFIKLRQFNLQSMLIWSFCIYIVKRRKKVCSNIGMWLVDPEVMVWLEV